MSDTLHFVPDCQVPPSWSEVERLAALERYAVLGTAREPAFDDIAALAADIFDAPIGVVNFVAGDRQFFKAEVGIGRDSLPLDVSICRHALLQPGVFVVADLAEDPRFENNPLVEVDGGLRFYAGALIATPEGLPLGTVCVLDRQPRPGGIGPGQERALRTLASQAMALLELRRGQTAVRESESRFRNMADNAPVMMWVTDPTGHCTYLNKGWYEYTGQTPSAGEAYGWLDAIHPDDRLLGEQAFVSANAERRPYRVEFRLRRADGVYRWVIDAAAPRFGDDGTYLGYVGSVFDIQERYESEAALRLSESRFRAAVDAFQGIVWTNDPAGRMVGEQPGWSRLTGQSQEQYQGFGWAEAVHPNDAEPTVEAWNLAVAKRRLFEFEHRLRRADGSWGHYAVRAVPVFSSDGDILEWVGVHADITAQAQAEAKLRQSEAELRDERDRIRDYLHVAEVMILVLADSGCIRTINRRGAEILGYKEPETLIGRDWFELAVPPAHRTETRAVFAKLMAGELDAVSAYENPVLRADGEERLVAWRNTLLKDAQGRIVGTLSSGDDITDERLAQEREQLLAQEIDHRAKNLLAVVQSVVQLTRTEDIHGFKEAVTGRIQSLARTHGLLAAARWEGADLKQLVADELAPYSRNDPSRANISGPNVQLIPAAAQAFALAIHELATNSAKYGSLGASTGRLSVSWQWEVGAEPCLLFRWVENGGPPVIPPTRRGFGSVVLQSSIEGQLKGAVHLDWRAEGLVCELLLPSAEVIAHGKGAHERKIIQPNSTRTVRTSKQLRILVVEDEALVAAQIEDVLEACGHQVCVVSRLADAFDRLYRLELDVALLDINVAGERSYPLADLLLAKGVPFAFCSGYGENAGLPARLSYIPLVAKPFDRDDLVSTVTALLG